MSQPAKLRPPVSHSITSRLSALVKAFAQTDLIRLRVCDEETEFDMRRTGPGESALGPASNARNGAPAVEIPGPKEHDFVASDIVGIVHLTRPAVTEGTTLDGDRELAHVEALGIRNSVRSRGPGRVVAVLCKDGDAVDYGRPLFEIDR